MRPHLIALMALSIGVSACRQAPSETPVAGGAEFRLERFCNLEGFKPSLRQTYLFIDELRLARTVSPEEFVARNSAIRDAVLAFADPERATASGVSDYRERISIYVLPVSGGGAKRLFTGCLPALSPEESAKAGSSESAVGAFFTGGRAQALTEDVEIFRSRVIKALTIAASVAPEEAGYPRGPLADTSLFRSLRASGRLVVADEGVRRVVLVSDLGRINPGAAQTRQEARQAGFKDGSQTGVDFGRAELVVLSSGAGKELVREYADAFFLSQHADLAYFGDNPAASASPAPVRVQRYTGKVQYPRGAEAVQIRVAIDRDGRLTQSWMILRGQPDRSTPLTGQAVCELGGDCDIRSDDGGFAQAWSLAPGGEPEFKNDAPFAGMRAWTFAAGPEQLTGKIYDPAVTVGASGSDSIPVTASLQASATF